MQDPALLEREHKTYMSLLASAHADTVVNRVIKERDPCVLSLQTGAGKSTAVPYAFIKAGYRVVIALPTVAMCNNITSSFSSLFPSVSVGTVFSRERNVPKDARLVVMTNGSLKSTLLNYVKRGTCVSMEFTDILILDEVHMATLDTHVIVSIWYYCATRYATSARMPRLLLSSATTSDVLFSRRFPPCVVLPEDVLTRTPYPITPHFASRDYTIEDTARYKDIGELLRTLHQTKPVTERILVFLPGRGEMAQALTASGLKPNIDITLVTMWSESSEADLQPLQRAVDNDRLICFATPSADAGLTITNLVHVIDSLLVKNSHVQPNGSEALITELASKQLARQRKGRVGRISAGHYYPMCSEEFFNSGTMPESYGLEILRRPLYSDIIELVSHGIQVEEVFAIYNIPTLGSTIEQLLNWGLLRRSGTSSELYTSSGGSFMSQTGVASPRLAGILYAWIRIGQPVSTGVVLTHLIAAFTSDVLQIPEFQPLEGESRGQMEKRRIDFVRKTYGRFLGSSDVQTAIRLWNIILNETSSTEILNNEAIERWCTANSIKWHSVKSVLKSIQKTIPRIRRETVRLAARESQDPTSIVDSPNLTLDEGKTLPIVRRLMEHVYSDQIASRGNDHRVVYMKQDGTTITPPFGRAFTQHMDPETALQYPKKIVIIGQRTNPQGQLKLTQFLDIDNPSEIAHISTEELNSRLGIFLSRRSRSTRSIQS